MAKPLRYGPTIGVRLPLELHEHVVELAGEPGPGPWLRDLVVEHFGGRNVTGLHPAAEPSDDAEHKHHKAGLNKASLIVCACGAVQGVDGKWRQP